MSKANSVGNRFLLFVFVSYGRAFGSMPEIVEAKRLRGVLVVSRPSNTEACLLQVEYRMVVRWVR